MQNLKTFFNRYALEFNTDNAALNDNITLKIVHSFRVLEEAENLAIELSETERRTLSFAALFHDISRFEQIRDFATFDDRASFDHGLRSTQIIAELDLVNSAKLNSEEAAAAIWAIEHHNKKLLPKEPPSTLHEIVAKLLRDSDKLDIFRVHLENLRNPGNEMLIWGTPEHEDFSPKIVADLLAGLTTDHFDLKSKADYLLSKLGWAYDLNSRRAKDEFIRRRYLEQMLEFLPNTPEVLAVFERATATLVV